MPDVATPGIGHNGGPALEIETAEVFEPLLAPRRYKDAVGGRGSGKSHFYGELAIEMALCKRMRIVCIREVQKSLEQSVKPLLERKIQKFNAGSSFEVLKDRINTPHGGLIIFQGMQNHTAESIKSLEDFDVAWVEEAQALSQRSLDLLYPTIRNAGSELWFSRNRRSPKDPVDVFFRAGIADGDPRFISVVANWMDNPWFPEEIRLDMERDRRRDPDRYAHIWGGGYQTKSQARVFTNWRIDEFETPPDARFMLGADWGYSIDPSVMVRCFIDERARTLYFDQEAYAIGVEVDHLPYLFGGFDDPELKHLNRAALETALRQPWARHGDYRGIPGARRWPAIGDSARPETISYLNKHGFLNIRAARKGPGSVEDGIEFLRGYDIVVHPRCTHVIDELTYFSYKVDAQTDEVLPVFLDKKNHTIDSARYAVEPLRRVIRPAPLIGAYQQMG